MNRTRLPLLLAVVATLLSGLFGQTAQAQTDPYPWVNCASSTAFDPAVPLKADYISAELSAIQSKGAEIHVVVGNKFAVNYKSLPLTYSNLTSKCSSSWMSAGKLKSNVIILLAFVGEGNAAYYSGSAYASLESKFGTSLGILKANLTKGAPGIPDGVKLALAEIPNFLTPNASSTVTPSKQPTPTIRPSQQAPATQPAPATQAQQQPQTVVQPSIPAGPPPDLSGFFIVLGVVVLLGGLVSLVVFVILPWLNRRRKYNADLKEAKERLTSLVSQVNNAVLEADGLKVNTQLENATGDARAYLEDALNKIAELSANNIKLSNSASSNKTLQEVNADIELAEKSLRLLTSAQTDFSNAMRLNGTAAALPRFEPQPAPARDREAEHNQRELLTIIEAAEDQITLAQEIIIGFPFAPQKAISLLAQANEELGNAKDQKRKYVNRAVSANSARTRAEEAHQRAVEHYAQLEGVTYYQETNSLVVVTPEVPARVQPEAPRLYVGGDDTPSLSEITFSPIPLVDQPDVRAEVDMAPVELPEAEPVEIRAEVEMPPIELPQIQQEEVRAEAETPVIELQEESHEDAQPSAETTFEPINLGDNNN